MKTFKVRYVWELGENSGYSSYTLRAKDSIEAERRAHAAASRDFPKYTCHSFHAEEI